VEIIAEIGSTHDGSLGNAITSIRLAAEAGATHCKFQTHIAEHESLKNAPSPPYFVEESRYEYFERTAFSEREYIRLISECDANNVEFMSSPFCIEAVDLLERAGCRNFKIASGEVTNLPLLERVGATDGRIYLSSGMSDWNDLDDAVKVLNHSDSSLTVMQCASQYPCRPKQVGLNVFREMRQRYGCKIGFSDHTEGLAAAVLAVSHGAICIEKHFTISRLLYGSDAKNSLDPQSFTVFCREILEAREMLRCVVDKDDISPFLDMKIIFEKSIVAKRPLERNHVIGKEDLAFKKPGDGIKAKHYSQLVGKKLARAVQVDEKLSWDDLV